KFICGRGTQEQVNFDFAGLRDTKQWIYNIISKQHFRLDRVEGRTVLTDLSFNGTFVNQKLVGKFRTYLLDNGDVISCGRSDLHGNFFKHRKMDSLGSGVESRVKKVG
ncbi:hypothetical protein COOONC_14005, partial [Cooperia oncophora]